MRLFFRSSFVPFIVVALGLFAACSQENGNDEIPAAARTALDAFLERDNAGKDLADLATEASGAVTIQTGKGLNIVASAPDGNTYVLRREEAADIDFLLPKTFAHATLVYADRSAIIINHAGTYHYVLSLDAQPDLPAIPDAEFVVFSGNGLIRFPAD